MSPQPRLSPMNKQPKTERRCEVSETKMPETDEHGNPIGCMYRIPFNRQECYFYTEQSYRTLERRNAELTKRLEAAREALEAANELIEAAPHETSCSFTKWIPSSKCFCWKSRALPPAPANQKA